MRGRLYDIGLILVVIGILVVAWIDLSPCYAMTPECLPVYAFWTLTRLSTILAGLVLVIVDLFTYPPR